MNDPIRRIVRNGVILLALLLSPVAQVFGEDAGPLYGRVSAIEGDLMIKGAQEDEWSYGELNGIVGDEDNLLTGDDALAEIEMPGQVFLRLGQSTGLDVTSVEEGRYGLWTGVVYVSLLEGEDRVVAIETPACTVLLTGEALARIDVHEDGPVRVDSLRSKVEVLGAGESLVTLSPRMQLHVNSKGEFVQLQAIAQESTDRLAQWNETREADLIGKELPAFVPPEAVGARELAGNGEWVVEDNVRFWRPSVAAYWWPYYAGTWRYIGPVGWCWVPRYSFEYVTCHYGTWRHSHRYGWLWRPRLRWRPACVAWTVHGDGVFWAPLDYYDRPVMVYRRPHFLFDIIIGDHSTLHYGSWYRSPFRYLWGHRPRYKIVSRKVIINANTVNIYKIRNVKIVNRIKYVRPARPTRSARTLSGKARADLLETLARKPRARRFETDERVSRRTSSDRLAKIHTHRSRDEDVTGSQLQTKADEPEREKLVQRVRDSRETILRTSSERLAETSRQRSRDEGVTGSRLQTAADEPEREKLVQHVRDSSETISQDRTGRAGKVRSTTVRNVVLDRIRKEESEETGGALAVEEEQSLRRKRLRELLSTRSNGKEESVPSRKLADTPRATKRTTERLERAVKVVEPEQTGKKESGSRSLRLQLRELQQSGKKQQGTEDESKRDAVSQKQRTRSVESRTGNVRKDDKPSPVAQADDSSEKAGKKKAAKKEAAEKRATKKR